MLDKKTTCVLKALHKLTEGNAYKVVNADEILSNVSQRSQFDVETIKQSVEFLEKQQYIIIKFSEESTYCYSLLPKARIYLEQELTKVSNKKTSAPMLPYLYTMLASFIGTMFALLIFFYLTF